MHIKRDSDNTSNPKTQPKSNAQRMIATPTPYTRTNCLYVQEIGSLISVEPHVSRREKLESYLFLIVLSGRGRLFYQETSFELRQGDCVWIDCAQPYLHESSPDAPWELKWVHFYGAGADTFYQSYREQGHPFCFSPANAGAFNQALSAMYTLHREDAAQKELLCHKYLTDIITLCFLEHAELASEKNRTFTKITSVREYLKEHFAEPVSLDLLSSLFFISKFHLAREYKQVFGTTLMGDLTSLRLSHAKSLLRFSEASVESVAVSCGYQNANYFIKVFKRTEGMTPLEYRRKW